MDSEILEKLEYSILNDLGYIGCLEKKNGNKGKEATTDYLYSRTGSSKHFACSIFCACMEGHRVNFCKFFHVHRSSFYKEPAGLI